VTEWTHPAQGPSGAELADAVDPTRDREAAEAEVDFVLVDAGRRKMPSDGLREELVLFVAHPSRPAVCRIRSGRT
jgi:hypothetical protein